MADEAYSKVSRRMWRDGKFGALSAPQPNAQSLWQYLLTGTHCTSIPGLLAVGVGGLADELNWSPEDTRRCLEEIVAADMAKVDFRARLVWLPNSLDHNMPANVSVVQGWAKFWKLLPECDLRTEAQESFRLLLRQEDLVRAETQGRSGGLEAMFQVVIGERSPTPSSGRRDIGATAHGVPHRVDHGVDQGVRHRADLQEHDQEQEQDQDPGNPLPPGGGEDGAAHGETAPITARSNRLTTKKPTKATGKSKIDTSPLLLGEPERAAYDAIVGDVSLQPIVQTPAACAADLVSAAPGVNVAQEIRHAGAWLRANPAQRKSNGNRFLLNWVRLKQERAPIQGHAPHVVQAVASPEVERTMRYFGNKFTKTTGKVYPAPTADLKHAVTMWTDAEKGAREAESHTPEGQYKPNAEACVISWVDRFFQDQDQKVKDANYPFSWLVSRIGQYGLPKRDPRQRKPIAPVHDSPLLAAPATAPAATTAAFSAGLLADMSKPGAAKPDQPTIARSK